MSFRPEQADFFLLVVPAATAGHFERSKPTLFLSGSLPRAGRLAQREISLRLRSLSCERSHESHDPSRRPRHPPPAPNRQSPQSPSRTRWPHPPRNHPLPPPCLRHHGSHHQRPPLRRPSHRLSEIPQELRPTHRNFPRRSPPRHRRRPKKSRLVLLRRSRPPRRTLPPPQCRRNQHHRFCPHVPITHPKSRPSHSSRPIPRNFPPPSLRRPPPTPRAPHRQHRHSRSGSPQFPYFHWWSFRAQQRICFFF